VEPVPRPPSAASTLTAYGRLHRLQVYASTTATGSGVVPVYSSLVEVGQVLRMNLPNATARSDTFTLVLSYVADAVEAYGAPFDKATFEVGFLGDAESSLGGAKSSLGDAKSSLGDAKSSLGDAESSLGDAESSLGDAESSLGDAKSTLGDAKSSLGDANISLIARWVTLTPRRVTFRWRTTRRSSPAGCRGRATWCCRCSAAAASTPPPLRRRSQPGGCCATGSAAAAARAPSPTPSARPSAWPRGVSFGTRPGFIDEL
jgi:hypothetical protein